MKKKLMGDVTHDLEKMGIDNIKVIPPKKHSTLLYKIEGTDKDGCLFSGHVRQGIDGKETAFVNRLVKDTVDTLTFEKVAYFPEKNYKSLGTTIQRIQQGSKKRFSIRRLVEVKRLPDAE